MSAWQELLFKVANFTWQQWLAFVFIAALIAALVKLSGATEVK